LKHPGLLQEAEAFLNTQVPSLAQNSCFGAKQDNRPSLPIGMFPATRESSKCTG